MKDNIKFKDFYVKPHLPESLFPLQELAGNLWSTWNPDAFRLFSRIDPVLFRNYDHNPQKILLEIKQERWIELSENSGFINEMNSVYKNFKLYLDYEGCYTNKDAEKKSFESDFCVAYFSMEYGLHESLPIYSGGLGILSGDHLKAASDLGIPLVGFGLLYHYGYFNQKINLDGMQQEIYIENEWYSKAIEKVKDEKGNDLVLTLELRGEPIYLKAWIIKVGKVPLYLLDSNLEENTPQNRSITSHLYIADRQMRILQEIVLAFGGLELITALDLQPSIYHLNEGHSAFLIIKRLQKLIKEQGFSFAEATGFVKTSTVFTTHTPVPAGNEEFDTQLVRYFLENEITSCGLSFEQFTAFARFSGNDNFSMSAFAIRFSKYINGVSELHSVVSRKMWHPIYPQLYEDEFPIQAITNGVHMQSWLSRQMERLFVRYLGTDYQHHAESKKVWENLSTIPDVEIWEAHQQRKQQLISFVRDRLQDTLVYQGASATKANTVLNPNHLLIGFARRFATYKRGDLILQNKDRLLRILTDEKRPVQFIFSGKAHPADEKGKAAIKAIIDFARETKTEDRFVFLENYDINVARHLVQGVDVWLNNPIKPEEASGTSGMKTGMNGALNLSVLDGWWAECYTPQNGWSITSGENVKEAAVRNTMESNEIYDLLENVIRKLYYTQDKNGLPLGWIEMMKHSMYDIGLEFNMHKVLRRYLNDFYLPGTENIRSLSKNNYADLHALQEFHAQVDTFWDRVKFLKVEMNILPEEQIKSDFELKINAVIDTAGAAEDLFRIEAFYLRSEQDWQVVPLNFKERKDNLDYFETSLQVQGTGKQNINLRIRPQGCCYNDFKDYIKWYY
ncbi:MAG: alpha-glucan family phosphorylase [Candidatus Cloacimonadales bacterium]